MEITMDENTTTPDEFVKLRDQLALDLGAILNDTSAHDDGRAAEYLLASGLVPLSTIRARYDETHPASDPEPLTIDAPGSISNSAEGDSAPVGAVYEDADRPGQTWLYRKTANGWDRTGRDHAAGFGHEATTLSGHAPMYPLMFVRMDDLS